MTTSKFRMFKPAKAFEVGSANHPARLAPAIVRDDVAVLKSNFLNRGTQELHFIDEIEALLSGCMADKSALERAMGWLESDERIAERHILSELGLPPGQNEIRTSARVPLATVAIAYERAALVEKNIRGNKVHEYLRKVAKKPQHYRKELQEAQSTGFNADKPTVESLARMLIEEAAVTLFIGGRSKLRNRGTTIPLPEERTMAAQFLRGTRLCRGYSRAGKRVPNHRGPEHLSTAIAKTLGGNHSTVAREIVLLAGHLEATLFSGDMDGLMARAAQAAMATTAPIGLSKFEPAKYWTLAWGCLELVVAFSPPPIKPTTTESGVLQRIMAAIHYLVVAHSDTLRDAVTVSQEDDNVATKEMDKTGKTVGSAQMDAVVKIWGKGRPAVLFCGEAAASLEHARVTAFRSAQPHLQELFGDWSNGDVPKVEAPKDDWEYAEDYEVPATPKRPRVRRTVRYDIG